MGVSAVIEGLLAAKIEDPRRLLAPHTIARISRLDLRARQVVEGFISGMHKSPVFGHSIEFVQHREYTSGDDIRHLDWKVWSKTDRYYIKQYEAETNLRTTLVVDVSETTDIEKILRRVAESMPGRGMVVLISDLLCDREPLLRGLEMLCHRRHDI